MKATATKTGITLRLNDEEALCLAALLGRCRGNIASWYDPIADVIEGKTENVDLGDGEGYVGYTPISTLVDRNAAASAQREANLPRTVVV